VDALFRVVRLAGDRLEADRTGPGRGAWLCRGSEACLQEAARRHGFDRAFRAPVEAAAVERLRASLESASKEAAPDVRG
jgi:predicted RNA-binding protein YlxR (DUF448 family)